MAPVSQPYGELNERVAGDVVPLLFREPALTGTDILASNSPFSRRVDCDTLAVPSAGASVTPREQPVTARAAGRSRLTRSATGQYQYNWLTEAEWAGTCRELVLTRKDGIQHRAYFRF